MKKTCKIERIKEVITMKKIAQLIILANGCVEQEATLIYKSIMEDLGIEVED